MSSSTLHACKMEKSLFMAIAGMRVYDIDMHAR